MPLVLTGFLPLWACLLLCVVTALGLRFPAWGTGRAVHFMLVAGLAALSLAPAALAAGQAALIGLAINYIVWVLLVLALHTALNLLQSG